MADDFADISVIIPVRGGDETRAQALAKQLSQWPLEIILSQEGSRATSLNMGARKARGRYLWFLHADSILDDEAFEKLLRSLATKPESLHYFKLGFSDIDSSKMRLNAWGANLRSLLFKTPFGDQGFCLRKDLYAALRGFDEDAPYGEDHLFVWKARRKKIRLARVQSTILTSPRAYIDHGWLKTTLHRQYLWIKQALPQFWLLIRKR